jgi:chromosome segregation ATPase
LFWRRKVKRSTRTEESRISALTEELRVAVEGIREGKQRVQDLVLRLTRDHAKAFRSHVRSLTQLVSRARDALAEERRRDRQEAQQSFAAAEERLDELSRRLENRIESSIERIHELEARAASFREELADDWQRFRSENEIFRDSIREELRGAHRQVDGCRSDLRELSGSMEDVQRQQTEFGRQLADTRWQFHQMEVQWSQQQELTESRMRSQRLWSAALTVGAIAAVALIFLW